MRVEIGEGRLGQHVAWEAGSWDDQNHFKKIKPAAIGRVGGPWEVVKGA